MEAALGLFANNGFHNTSIIQIAKKAGVSKGLMYNYFKGKGDLLEAIIMSAYKENSEQFIAELNQPDTPKEHLSHIIDMMGNMLKNKFKHIKLLTALSFQEDVNKLINSELMPKKDVIIQQFIRLFEEMGFKKAKEEAYLVGAMLDGVAIHYMTIGKEYPLDEMLEFIKDKYCR